MHPIAQADPGNAKHGHGSKTRTPLPKLQMTVIMFLHLAEPISATIIYPFIAQLIKEILNPEGASVGYYVGLIESLFFVTQGLFVLQWGCLSDLIGRKPVLIIGFFGLSLSMLSFGISKSFWSLAASRAIAGALNGNIGVLKSVLGEITDSTNAPKAFSFVPIMWFLGGTLAPLIGGYLCNPAERMPQIFTSPIWLEYPYLLPCLFAATFSLLSALVAYLFLEETLVTLRATNPIERPPMRARTDSEATLCEPDERQPLLSKSSEKSRKTSILSLVTGRVLLTIVNYAFLALLEISLSALLPLFLASPPLSFTPVKIGVILSIMGFVNGVIQITCFTTVHDFLGTKRVYLLGVASFIAIYIALALLSLTVSGGDMGYMGWSLLGLVMVLCPIENMAFNCIFLYVAASAQSPATLGATNGIAQTSVSLARAIGPAMVTSLFAFTNNHPEIAGGVLVYSIFGVLTIFALGFGQLLPDRPWDRNYSKVIEEDGV